MGMIDYVWTNVLVAILLVLFLYLGAATAYLLLLAIAYFVRKERPSGPDKPLNRFAILVPAHNEEQLVGNLCKSLLEIDYPRENTEIFVIADNCTDETVNVCQTHPVTVLEREDSDNAGKGQAIAWALKQIQLTEFDAVFIVDADSYVNSGILADLNRLINQGEQAIQCYSAVGNRDDSGFTQLLFVSRTINNLLYHEAKFRLGLSAYLTGNGLCFRSDLLQKRGWTAFSAGEDWEYYAQLVADNIRIGFAANAKVFHQESRSLNQATSQRLRWSSGRFSVAKNLGIPLFLKGIRQRRWLMADAAAPLLFPNYSLQINLTLGGIILALLLPSSTLKLFFLVGFFLLLIGQSLLFAAGAFIAGSPGKVFRAVLYVPVFLVWKSVIDILCVTGLYRGRDWVRTRRH
jgi:cellulose synthase/poly-beta-1,6-N-acetylglucosamine synthase-like glycosyltransferase